MPRSCLARQALATRTAPRHGRLLTTPHAKRVRPPLTPLDGRQRTTSEPAADASTSSPSPSPSTDWTAFALEGADDHAVDADFAAAVNELATTAARSILNGTDGALQPGSAWHAEVSSLGDFCTRKARSSGGNGASPDNPWFQGALLSYLLLEVAAGRWPSPQADALTGPFRDAAVRLHGLLENSGWKLVRPEDVEEEEEGAAV